MTTYGAVHRRASTYGDVCCLTSTFVGAECVDVRHRTQCERGFRTTNDGATSVRMTVLEKNDLRSTSFAQRNACWPPSVMQFNDYLMRKTDYKTMRFLVYMYYTHSCYQTSIFGKNCAYYIRIFTVIACLLQSGEFYM